MYLFNCNTHETIPRCFNSFCFFSIKQPKVRLSGSYYEQISLTSSLQLKYHIQHDTSAKSKYFIDGEPQQLTFYGLPVDTVWLETDKSNLIKEITIKTAELKKGDFRAFDFEWTTLLNNMSNDFGVYKKGQARFTNKYVALWTLEQRAWLYATTEKVYPWQKNQQRFVLRRWQRFNNSSSIDI